MRQMHIKCTWMNNLRAYYFKLGLCIKWLADNCMTIFSMLAHAASTFISTSAVPLWLPREQQPAVCCSDWWFSAVPRWAGCMWGAASLLICLTFDAGAVCFLYNYILVWVISCFVHAVQGCNSCRPSRLLYCIGLPVQTAKACACCCTYYWDICTYIQITIHARLASIMPSPACVQLHKLWTLNLHQRQVNTL
jgi:hypothetical protein